MLLAGGAGDEHVRGLHVAVHEPLFVGGVEAVRDLLEEGDRARGSERVALRQELPQVGALHVAHGEEERTVFLSRLEDGDDVRVVEGGGHPRLPEEALAEAGVLRELGRDHLERDLAPEGEFLRAVDRAHAAAPDERLDVVARELAPDHRVGAPPSSHPSSVSRA